MNQSNRINIAEIESRYPSEWILIGDPEVDETQKVLGGLILFHSSDRDEMYRKAIELKPKFFATIFTGKLPANTAIVL